VAEDAGSGCRVAVFILGLFVAIVSVLARVFRAD
jgi:hypothetical protein